MTLTFGAIRAGLLGAALCVGLVAGPQLAKAEDTFKFGGVFTLSGPASFLGLFEEAAVRLAVEQFMKGDCIVEAVPPQPCEGGGLKIGDKVVPSSGRPMTTSPKTRSRSTPSSAWSSRTKPARSGAPG